MNKATRSYPRVQVDTARSGAVAQAGGVLLTQAAEVTGLTSALKVGLGRWRKPTATHDPGKILSDLALSLALGGDCLADLALLRAEPGVYGKVASEATVSRTIGTLAADAGLTIRAINRGRAQARAQAWAMAGTEAPDHGATAGTTLHTLGRTWASLRNNLRCEDRIRIAKDTGLTNLPLHSLAQNTLWCHLVLMAMELTAWTQLLAFAGHPARRWEPKRLRHRIFTLPATLARTGRRALLHLKQDAPHANLALSGWTTLTALAPP